MNRYLILLGGGDLKRKETLELDRAIGSLAKRRAGDRRPCALFIGTASHDLMPYYNTFHKTYTGELGLKTDVALTVYTGMDSEKLDGKFERADMIYVGGGDTVFMLDSWQKTGLGERILQAYERGVPVAGLSAGAICWFEKMYTDSANTASTNADSANSARENTPYTVRPGMGLLRGGACPHYEDRREDFAGAMPEGERWLCIENNAAAVYCNGELLGALKTDGGAGTCGGTDAGTNTGKNVYTVEKNGGILTETPVAEIAAESLTI